MEGLSSRIGEPGRVLSSQVAETRVCAPHPPLLCLQKPKFSQGALVFSHRVTQALASRAQQGCLLWFFPKS